MSEFNDEEYESFDLDGPADARASATDADDADEVDTDEDSDDNDADDNDADDDDADDEDDEDDEEPEDAGADEIDFVVAAYREDGQPVVQALNAELANDLEELVVQLRRLPADAGAIGFVSLVEEVFVIARVRGRHVQVLLNDAGAAADWPIARDVADLLGEEVPDPDEDTDPMGDLGILADLGVSELDMAAITDNVELGSDQMLAEIADKIKIGPQFRKATEAALSS